MIRRECGCPEWVIRCAHFGDRAVTLDDITLTLMAQYAFRMDRFGVALWDGDLVKYCQRYTDEAIARFAFTVEEVAMIEGAN